MFFFFFSFCWCEGRQKERNNEKRNSIKWLPIDGSHLLLVIVTNEWTKYVSIIWHVALIYIPYVKLCVTATNDKCKGTIFLFTSLDEKKCALSMWICARGLLMHGTKWIGWSEIVYVTHTHTYRASKTEFPSTNL